MGFIMHGRYGWNPSMKIVFYTTDPWVMNYMATQMYLPLRNATVSRKLSKRTEGEEQIGFFSICTSIIQ